MAAIWTATVKVWQDGVIAGNVTNGYRFFGFEKHPSDAKVTIHGEAPDYVKRKIRETVQKAAA